MTAAVSPIARKAIVFKSSLLPLVAEALGGVLQLAPPPTPKGRYALAKAMTALEPKYKLFMSEQERLIRLHATVDEKGQPKVDVKVHNARSALQFVPKDPDAFRKEMAAIDDEEASLEGCRMITHAELGDCPITGAQERALIMVGLLEDREPE